MSELTGIRVEQPPVVPEWTQQDQEILEWMFPQLAQPPRPMTPPHPEPPRLQRTCALSRREWADLLSVV